MIIVNFVIVFFVIFAVIVFVLKKLIFTDTTSAVNRLNDERLKTLKKQEELGEKMKQFEEECKNKILQTQKESEDTRMSIITEAEKKAGEIAEKARLQAEDIVKKTNEAVESLKKAIIKEANLKTIDFSTQIIEKSLTEEMTTELNELFIQKFLKDLDAIDTQFMEGVTDAVLYTRYKGDGKLAVKIAEMLKAKLGRDVKITEEEEKGVVAGVALKFGTMLVDGTLASKLRENAEKLKLEMEK